MAAKKAKQICSVHDSWFEDDEFKHVIQKNHMNNTVNSVCLLCCKSVSIEHQGCADLTRHINGESHKRMQNAKRGQSSIDSIFSKKSDPLELQVRKAEVRLTGFIAEYNIPLAVADHLGPLFKDIFPDSKIVKNCACGKTKATCIFNQAIKPDLQSSLLEHIKNNYFSISTDGNNDQGLCKMNPITVRLFDINQHKVVTQFLDMCLSSSSTADGIFTSIDNAFVQIKLS